MMARRVVTLNHAGVSEILKSNCRKLVDDVAQQLGQRASVHGSRISNLDVQVESLTTDRAVGRVHVCPLPAQLKMGVLTRAAADLGLEVKSVKR